MSLDHDINALAADAAKAKVRLQRVAASIARMTQLQSDARTLFLDADGEVRPEAARLFSHLAAHADVAGINGPVSDAELREALGAQRMVRLLLKSLLLDAAKLRRLQSLLNTLKGQS
ncbi:hypothetical protein AI27_05095 [Sphingomonas sp. BHC-A]|nr:hypothetical protein AI27_05095 [Sphingomonas sp. BHC-A]